MKYRTPKKQRATYVYKSRTGEKFTLRPDEDGVTSADIASLHDDDDKVWNADRRENRVVRGKEEVARIVSLEGIDPDSIFIRDTDPLPDEVLIETENAQELEALRSAVREAVSQLPEKQKNAVTAVWLNGMRPGEYATQSGMSKSSVSNQLNRGFDNLRKKLEKVFKNP